MIVKPEDAGKYRCHLTMGKQAEVCAGEACMAWRKRVQQVFGQEGMTLVTYGRCGLVEEK